MIVRPKLVNVMISSPFIGSLIILLVNDYYLKCLFELDQLNAEVI